MSFTVLGTKSTPDGVEIELQVPADCPFFRGHFPRHPILPAVALLDLIARLGAAHSDLGPAPCSLSGLRLRGSILPNARFSVQLNPSSESLGFRVLTEGSLGLRGRFGYAPGPLPVAFATAPTGAFGRLQPESPTQANALPLPSLPHDGSALFLKQVEAVDSEAVLCRMGIPADSPFRSTSIAAGAGQSTGPFSGQVTAQLILELAAQASAAHGVDEPGGSSEAAKAGRGFIVNVREAWFGSATIDADQEFMVEARQTSLAPPLRNYAAVVKNAAGDPVGAAQLGTWVPSGESTG